MVGFARSLRSVLFGGLLLAGACSGGINCGGCIQGQLETIPGGFPDNAKIGGFAQARVTRSGMDFFERDFAALASAFAGSSCGGVDDVPCATAFNTVCDQAQGQCVHNMTGATEPVLGFAIDREVDSSGATVCRDDLTDPNRRSCHAWLRLEGLALEPRGPNVIEATITARMATSPIPLEFNRGILDMDCLVDIDSTRSGSPLQDFVLTVEIGEWAGAGSQRQLEVAITDLVANLSSDDITISRDPVHGTTGDIIACGLGNLSFVKDAIVGQLTGRLSSTIDTEIRKLTGRSCNVIGAEPCPMDSTCSSDRLCVDDASGKIVPQLLGAEGRVPLDGLLSGLSGNVDLHLVVGGPSGADTTGATIGVLGGLEAPPPAAACAMELPSPRLRPGWTAPRDFPSVGSVDLDFDGTLETDFMVGIGLSQAALDQAAWMIYSTGLFCASVSSFDTELINTGSLSVLMPSLRKLTLTDRPGWPTRPARLLMRPGAEPRIRIGTGQTGGTPDMPVLQEGLMNFELQDLELYFSALVEERWVHLMTVVVDIELPLGLAVTPTNGFEILIGDVESGITNVRIRDSDLLGESKMELADAVPTLVSLILPQITDLLQLPLGLPTAAELGGFDLQIVGIRGVEDGAGGHDQIGLYANLDFDPSLAPSLLLAAETTATVTELRLPASAEQSVTYTGGPTRPEVVLALGGNAPIGRELEFQYRVDRNPWSPFFSGDSTVVRAPEFLVQGPHRIEVRARIEGDYRSLDATPVVLPIVIDTEPPLLEARLDARRGGAVVRAGDVVSGSDVRVEVGVDGQWSEAALDEDGFVGIAEIADADVEIAVAATDAVGLRAEKVLRSGGVVFASVTDESPDAQAPSTVGACRCVSTRSSNGVAALGLMIGLFVFVRRRR